MKPQIPKELLMEIARGNCVAFIGSGPSKAAGFPDWYGLIRLMIDWCDRRHINLPNRLDIEHLVEQKRDFLAAADAIKTNMGDQEYYLWLSEVFDVNKGPVVFHQLLTRIPFAAVATTNYEPLVEMSYQEAKPKQRITVFTHADHELLGQALHSKDFFVLKAHGTADRLETIVLGKGDYIKLIHGSEGYRTFLKTLFLDRTVFFVGFSMTDPELLLLLEEIREIFEDHTPTHYALLDVTTTTETEQKQFHQYCGVKVIPYTPSSGNHPEVEAFLTDVTTELPKYLIAHTISKGFEPVRDLLNSDSHYRLVMNSDNQFTVMEKFEGASKEKPLRFSIKFTCDSKTVEGREAHEALKKLLTTGETATIKSPHLAQFVPPELLSALLPERTKEMEVTIGPVVGRNTLMVRAIVETSDGKTEVLENIELKNIQSGSEQMILSNEHQGFPWTFRQVIRHDEQASQSTVTFNLIDVPIKQAVKGARFARALSKGGLLKIESEETDCQLSHAVVGPLPSLSQEEGWIKACEALEIIQKKTGVRFKSPEILRAEDAKQIAAVAEIVMTGKATIIPPRLEVGRNEAEGFLINCSEDKPLSLTNYADEWVSVILGQRVSLGPVLITAQKLYILAEDALTIRQELEAGRDTISVRLTPLPDSPIEARYPEFLTLKEETEVINNPIVRKTSLNNLINALFEAATNKDGTFSSAEFLSLLQCARAESENENVLINPLKNASDADITDAIQGRISRLEDDLRLDLTTKLTNAGWLQPNQEVSSVDSSELVIAATS